MEEPDFDRNGGRRLSRSRRVNAEMIWREGFAEDPMGGIKRKRDLRGRQGKIQVDKLPDVLGEGRSGIVVGVSRRTCEVEPLDHPDTTVECSYSPRLRLTQESLLAVGDKVEIHALPGSGWLLTSIQPRRTRISRPGPDARDHLDIVVAANLDVLVIVASCDRPAFHPRLVDRFLVTAQLGGVEPMIFLNKSDLAPLPDLDTYRRMGIPVVAGSANTGEGLPELQERIGTRWAAFAGSSGVGKSSLVRAMIPDAAVEIGEVRRKDGRGRHTTTRSGVFRLPGGGRIIDTPGIRELALHRLSSIELQLYFSDFDAYFGKCRFNDCLHREEPGCAVASAVERGEIHADRWSSYLRILESIGAT
ncbi:MAG: ribosome small subunit-dependent GTPase A [Fibrobacterota bacterium]|nr:ribosome small subunit-dependent GTPase A [Fibrobacterota bacterium]QQS03359.1 MAG: ribosome small subunit-dependent GTPase A [Fibrobacterota bacterium]